MKINFKLKKKKKNLHPKKKTSWRVRQYRKFRHIFRFKRFLLSRKFFFFEVHLKRFLYKINIRLGQNNVFCTWLNALTKKSIFTRSSGRYNVKITRKRLRFNYKLIVRSFLREVKRKIKNKKKIRFLIEIICPIRIRKKLVKLLVKSLKRHILILTFKEKKCFNGCRPKKMRRKKQKRFIVSK